MNLLENWNSSEINASFNRTKEVKWKGCARCPFFKCSIYNMDEYFPFMLLFPTSKTS